jgi:hypothetical protein
MRRFLIWLVVVPVVSLTGFAAAQTTSPGPAIDVEVFNPVDASNLIAFLRQQQSMPTSATAEIEHEPRPRMVPLDKTMHKVRLAGIILVAVKEVVVAGVSAEY